jgi:serine protease SohB
LLKNIVQVLDIQKVATGEHWYGKRAVDLGLVDKLMTSDEYLLNASKTADIFAVRFIHKQNLMQKMGVAATLSADNLLVKWWDRLSQTPRF